MRADGKRVKINDNMYTIVPYFMVDRSDACNSITVRVPFQPVHEYVTEARKKFEKLSYISVIFAAYIRTVAEFPFLNRFVVNKKIYAHKNLELAMVVLRNGKDAQTSMGKMRFELTDTLEEVNKKLNDFIEANRQENANETDKILSFLVKLPGLIRFATNLIRWADKHGLLPAAILKMSPFHATAVFSNLASIRTNHIYHHIYNFGTIGQIFTIGNFEDIPKMKNGEVVLERQIPFGLVCDERIGDGHSYARAFAAFSGYLRNPQKLETPPEKVITD